ncbi:hypothetical protein CcaverHIS002_0211800 [Cutaneotrichosporon cavernicola]|nr:hypothetical protein CcaverHIS002_0211800 [Cutaneotrichosporon cavernicola]BEI97590.1 hypothetical protein CcaverHIS631_0211790 [Cutaneotrichosporon cavernicola]
MSKRHLRAAGALAAEPALVLDGITSIHPPPDALQIEAAFDSEAARKLSPSELSQAKAVLQDLRVPNQPHGPPGGLARLTDETVPDQVYTKWRRKLIALTQTAVPDLVAQLLIAHEACGAVHGASVVGGSLARFYVLGAGCVATDLGDPTGQTRDLSLLARPGTTLRNLLLNPILPAFLAAEPRPVCAWDVAPSPRLGPPLQLQVPLGEGLHTLAAMLEAARVRVESNGPVPARLPTILQDVMGVVKGHRMDVLFTDQNQNSNVIPTVDIIDRSVRMIPVTTHEMTKLIESAEWIPQAMYSSLDNLASTFQASPSNDTPAAHADSAATDVKTSSPRKGSISATEIAHDPEPDAWWQEKWPRPKSSHSSARTHHVETEEVADADLAAFKLGLAAGTEDELFDPDVEFFVSTGVDELAFPSISPAECPLQDTVPPAKKGATERSSFDTIRALITSTDPPQPDTDTLATVETDTDTLVAVKTDTDTLATVGTDTDTLATVGTDTDTLVTVETSRKAAPSLPPHLAALRALYDLEGDVVKTTEVTTKVDLPGMRQSASSMGFRGSSGTGPRRPGEEPPSAEK